MKCYLEGTQKIVPGKQLGKPAENVAIFLVLLRLKSVESDVLITLSVPHKGELPEMYIAKVNAYSMKFKQAIASFKIVSLEAFSNAMSA